jgi:hypothetical protein
VQVEEEAVGSKQPHYFFSTDSINNAACMAKVHFHSNPCDSLCEMQTIFPVTITNDCFAFRERVVMVQVQVVVVLVVNVERLLAISKPFPSCDDWMTQIWHAFPIPIPTNPILLHRTHTVFTITTTTTIVSHTVLFVWKIIKPMMSYEFYTIVVMAFMLPVSSVG